MSDERLAQEGIARLEKAAECDDWCELKPEECKALLDVYYNIGARERLLLENAAGVVALARRLVVRLELPTSYQRRLGDVVEDWEGLSIVEQHDDKIGDLVDELKEALK